MTALFVLRDKAIKPLLAAAQEILPCHGEQDPRAIDRRRAREFTPAVISPTVRTLMNKTSEFCLRSQPTTALSALRTLGLEATLVSRRKVKT